MYKLINEYINGEVVAKTIIRDNRDGSITSFGLDPMNTDYQEYLKWVAEGNEPLPPDSQE